jgi:rhodanese-related sulfurtransferase
VAGIKGIKDLVDAANAEVEGITGKDALALKNDGDTIFIDVRDIRELQRDGSIPGSFHCPRGMAEFWVDPESPYHKDVFSSGKRIVFFCAIGWRSALTAKTVQDMGLARVAHIEDGFNGWKDAGGDVEEQERKD